MDVIKVLETHLECPICLSVPRDGVMLQCLNGHNLCGKCFIKLGRYAKCPQGRCNFAAPPTRNFIVANLVEKFPFKWACKYQTETCSQFEGTRPELDVHEAACKKQLPIACPLYDCDETVSFGSVGQHLDTEHDLKEKTSVSRSNKGTIYANLKEINLSNARSLRVCLTSLTRVLIGKEYK
jgi:hypothetical protein